MRAKAEVVADCNTVNAAELTTAQFAIHVFALAEILHLDGVGQFIELLDDLLQRRVVAARDDGHARRLGVLRRADIERVNVVTTPAEQARHTRQHAELVLHEN